MTTPELLKAYQNSKYVVPALGLTILLDDPNESLRELLVAQEQATFCFITAYNPFSKSLSSEANTQRNEALNQDLSSYRVFSGYGQDKAEQWPAEASFLVLGITKDKAKELGKKYEQNAILFGELVNGISNVQLIVLF